MADMPRQGQWRVLQWIGLIAVGIVTVAALGALFLSHQQGRVAQLIEAAVALCVAAGSVAAWLLRQLRRPGQEPAAGSITGLSVAVPTGQLPPVIRGRDQLLKQLHALLKAPAGGPVVLAGTGGAGKSTVAATFAETTQRTRRGRRHRHVWWVSAADRSSLTGGLVTVARQLGASQADLRAIRVGGPDGPDRLWALLNTSDRRWLLIFDNADDPSVLASPAWAGSRGDPPATGYRAMPADGTGWVRASRRGLVIVTTRDSDPAAWGRDAQIHHVGALGEAEAAQVLLDCAPQAGREAEARELARRLGGLPLPLRIAGSDLDSDAALRRTFGDYTRALDDSDHPHRLLTSRPRIGVLTDSRSVVMQTWELSLDDLAAQGFPQARPLLRVLSCFAWATPIPRGMLTSPFLDRLLITSAGAPGSLCNLAAENLLEDALHGLQTLGLITIRPFSQRGTAGHAVLVQPVIADTNRAHLADATHERCDAALIRSAAIEIVINAVNRLGADRNADWPDYVTLGPHVHALVATAARQADRQQMADLVTVATTAACAHNSYGDLPSGERLARMACGLADRLGEDHPVRLRALHQLAWSVAMQGRWPEAEAMYHDVLGGFQRVLGDDDPDTLTTRHELAWAAACQGRWPEAEAAYREVLSARTRVLGADDRETLITRHELGWAVANQGREQEALPILRDVLRIRERVLGETDRRIMMTRRELAWVAARLGNLDTSEAAYRELIRACATFLREDHPDTLTARHELAWVMSLRGRRRAAAREYRRVLGARVEILGEDHPDTVATQVALASLLKNRIITPHHIV